MIVVALLAGVAAYSTVLLYDGDSLPSDPTEYVNVIGHQWYWEFCYTANNTCFNSTYDLTTNTVSGGALWAAPGAVVQVNTTGADVIHSFNIPALGVRIDAIPGRTNHFAFSVPNAAPGTSTSFNVLSSAARSTAPCDRSWSLPEFSFRVPGIRVRAGA